VAHSCRYLEQKRLYFSRFFFLSNDELLEILSETKDPTRVQPHLKKCFEGISSLTFTDDLDITHMISAQKESIKLDTPISTSDARGQVEKWLLELEGIMVSTIRCETLKSMDAYPNEERIQWVDNWPGMVVLAVTAKYWTEKTHVAITAGPRALEEYTAQCSSDILAIVEKVRAVRVPTTPLVLPFSGFFGRLRLECVRIHIRIHSLGFGLSTITYVGAREAGEERSNYARCADSNGRARS
jgi:hypothetical protein